VLHIILDQAGYHTCAAVKEWAAKNPRIQLHFLPAYSPNLNTIERAWKIMHEHTVNNVYSPTFKLFTEKIRSFFSETFPKKAPLWVDRLTDTFTPRYSPLIANSRGAKSVCRERSRLQGRCHDAGQLAQMLTAADRSGCRARALMVPRFLGQYTHGGSPRHA